MPYKTIHVRRKHIQWGEPGAETACPVALALHEAGFPGARVQCATYSLSTRRILLQERMVRWIKRYDQTRLGKPFKFRIKLPA